MAKLFNRKKSGAVVLAIVADLHLNSTVGLPPGLSFPLDDGGMYKASRNQRWLWDAWLDYWSIVDGMVKKHKSELWVVLNGDIQDGDHHDTRQIITRNNTTHQRMATQVLDPVAQRADHLFVTRGTTVHSGHSASCEEAIAEDLGAVQPKPERWSWWWLKLKPGGVTFDIAHHTTRGRRPWTKGNAAGRLAADTMLEYTERHEEPPQVVIRNHVHVYEDSGRNHRTFAVIGPCWQLSTEYGYRIGPGKLPSIGGLVFVCQDGEYQYDKPILYGPKRGAYWTGN